MTRSSFYSWVGHPCSLHRNTTSFSLFEGQKRENGLRVILGNSPDGNIVGNKKILEHTDVYTKQDASGTLQVVAVLWEYKKREESQVVLVGKNGNGVKATIKQMGWVCIWETIFWGNFLEGSTDSKAWYFFESRAAMRLEYFKWNEVCFSFYWWVA